MAAVAENKINNFKKIFIEETGLQDDEFEKKIDGILEAWLPMSFDELVEEIKPPLNFLEWIKADASKPEFKSLTEEQQFRYGIKLCKLYDEMKRRKLPTV